MTSKPKAQIAYTDRHDLGRYVRRISGNAYQWLAFEITSSLAAADWRSGESFYEFRLDDRIPKDRLLRRINVVVGPKHI